MSSSPDPTLLLQDLLSPPSPLYPPPSLARQLSYHLASLPLSSPHTHNLLTLLLRYSASSTSLLPPSSTSADASPSSQDLRAAYEAVRQGVVMRLEALTRPSPAAGTPAETSESNKGASWTTRRRLHAFLAALEAGLFADPPASFPSSSAAEVAGGVRSVVRLALASAVLSALQEWKRRKEPLWVGGGKGIEGWERAVGRAWEEWAQIGGKGKGGEWFEAWTAAQILPFVEVEVLAKEFPVPTILRHLTDSFSLAFASGAAFSAPPLSSDLVSTPDGLSWTVPSPSHDNLASLLASPLFPLLGPLSRAIGRTTEAAALLASSSSSSPSAPAAIAAIQHLSLSVLGVSSDLAAGWAVTAWSDLTDDASLSLPTRAQTAPWTLLKSLLFAQTLIFSSLLVVVSTPANPDDEPTPLQRQLATQAVGALGKTYFVALRFGQSGFPAWKAVLGGLVEVVAAPHRRREGEEGGEKEKSPAEVLVTSLEPLKGTGKAGTHDRAVERAEATFWMNTVELVMREVGDEYVEKKVLRGIRPYLDDATYRDSFEAAHSVMLALFAVPKRCANEVAPWYTELLLRTYPSLLSPTQFRLAFSTLVAAVSASDDALAWWCIQELLAKLQDLPISTAFPSSHLPASSPSAVFRDLSEDHNDSAPPPALPSALTGAASPDPASATPLTPLDSRILTLPRGGHLLTLISLLPSVSLRLLPSLLSTIEILVREEPLCDGRAAVGEWMFGVLGEGMDASKRTGGTRWWMERGEGVCTGGPIVREEGEEEEEEDGEEEGKGKETVHDEL